MVDSVNNNRRYDDTVAVVIWEDNEVEVLDARDITDLFPKERDITEEVTLDWIFTRDW